MRRGTRQNPWLRLDRARKIIRAVIGAQFWWQKSPKGCDRHEELKRRLHRWDAGEVQGSHLRNSWTTAHWAASRKKKKKDETSDRRTTRNTRLCLYSERVLGSETLRLKWRPLSGAFGRTCSPQGNSQAQRQTQHKSWNKHHIPGKRTTHSPTTNSSTAGLSTRPIAVAATRFRPLSEQHPATNTHDERMTASVSPIAPGAGRPQCNRNRNI